MSDENKNNEKEIEKKNISLKEFKKTGVLLMTGKTYDIELRTKKIKFSM